MTDFALPGDVPGIERFGLDRLLWERGSQRAFALRSDGQPLRWLLAWYGLEPAELESLEQRVLLAQKRPLPALTPVVEWLRGTAGAVMVVTPNTTRTFADLLDSRPEAADATAARERIRLLVSAAAALEAWHTAGFAHGDLHPQGIVLTPDGRIGLVGPGCRPGESATAASDQYQLAMIGSELMAGLGSVPRALDTVLRRAQQRRPEDRFLTMQEFRQALEAALEQPREPTSLTLRPDSFRPDRRRSVNRSRRERSRGWVAVTILGLLACVNWGKVVTPPPVEGEVPMTLGEAVHVQLRPITYPQATGATPAPNAALDFATVPAAHVPDSYAARRLQHLWYVPPAGVPPHPPDPEEQPGVSPPEYEPDTRVDGALDVEWTLGYTDPAPVVRRLSATRVRCKGQLKVVGNAVTGSLLFNHMGSDHSVLSSKIWGGGEWRVTGGACHVSHLVGVKASWDALFPRGLDDDLGGSEPAPSGPVTAAFLFSLDLARVTPAAPSVSHLNILVFQQGERLLLHRVEGLADVAWPGYTIRRMFCLARGTAGGTLAIGRFSGTVRKVPFSRLPLNGPNLTWTTQLHVASELNAVALESRARCVVALGMPSLADRLWVTDLEPSVGISSSLFLPGNDLADATQRLPRSWLWLSEINPEVAPLTIEGDNSLRVVKNPPDGSVALPIKVLQACLPARWYLDVSANAIKVGSADRQGVIPLEGGCLKLQKDAHMVELPPWSLFRPRALEQRSTGAEILLLANSQSPAARAMASALEQILSAPLAPVTGMESVSWPRWVVAGGGIGYLSCHFLGPVYAGVLIAAGVAFLTLLATGWFATGLWLLAAVVGASGAGGRRRGAESVRLWLSRWMTHTGYSSVPPTILTDFPDAVAVARGGMGMVYRATIPETEEPVIIKSIAAEFANNVDFRRRFNREVSVLRSLDHPNIVHLLGARLDEVPYFVMEEFPSRSLESMIAERQRLTERETVRIGIGMSAGLNAAHSQRILHRDIKPANVLVADDGAVKLIDFGLAWVADATRITQTSAVLGTMRYMSPETLLGQDPTELAEIYALGVVLYECLTGTVPLAQNVMHRLSYGPVLPPARLADGVEDRTSDLVMRCLEAPATRWASARDLELALRLRLRELDAK